MNIELITTGNQDRAIVIFAGWAMDASPFRHLRREGYDIFIVSSYHCPTLDVTLLKNYRELIVIGWSMGVLYGELFLQSHTDFPVTKTIAVNGSPEPSDDTKGIPVAIYESTRRIANDRQLDKFYRRVCGGESSMMELLRTRPARHVEEAAEELSAISEFAKGMSHDLTLWDEIVVSRNDKIFPVGNLLNAWQSESDRLIIDESSEHMPDFQRIIDHFIIDKSLVGERFSAASKTYGANASIQAAVARKTGSKITPADGVRVLEIGSGAGLLTSEYQRKISNSEILAVDLAPQPLMPENGNIITTIAADAETAVRSFDDESFDIVVSSSTMQWFNSPRRFMREIARILKPGGKAVVSTYGRNTFSALSSVSPQSGLHYPSLGSSLFRRLNVEGTCESETNELSFQSAREALQHTRLTGVNATSRKTLSVADTKNLLKKLTKADGSASLDFEVIYITFTKPMANTANKQTQ